MLVQHNIRIISKYYSNLSLTRLAALTNINTEFCEEELCKLNIEKLVSCKIDRIDDMIQFNSKLSSEE